MTPMQLARVDNAFAAQPVDRVSFQVVAASGVLADTQLFLDNIIYYTTSSRASRPGRTGSGIGIAQSMILGSRAWVYSVSRNMLLAFESLTAPSIGTEGRPHFRVCMRTGQSRA